MSAEYNVSISALQPIVHGLTRSMEVTEEDSPAIRQCKCAISKELRSRWSLNSIDPTSPGCMLRSDPRFKQAKFPESHQCLDLQMAITDLARCEKADTEQQKQDLTTKKESDSTGQKPWICF